MKVEGKSGAGDLPPHRCERDREKARARLTNRFSFARTTIGKEGIPQGLKPPIRGWPLMPGLKPRPTSEATAKTKAIATKTKYRDLSTSQRTVRLSVATTPASKCARWGPGCYGRDDVVLFGGSGVEAWVLAHADEVGHDAEGTGDTVGHLAEEGVGEVDVGALSVAGVEEAALLGILIDVVHLGEGDVFGIPLAHEAVAALLVA